MGIIMKPNICSELIIMPFGFDPHEAEKIVAEIRDEICRIYVDVIVDWLPDGSMKPLAFTWEDGREIKVDRVLNVVKGHSLKAFSPGLRYRCQTGRRIYYLHFDVERWYIETKK
jgi:hypothetical protein